ncbi:unnamed protein product, partial [marine sediment metagenome]
IFGPGLAPWVVAELAPKRKPFEIGIATRIIPRISTIQEA